MSVARYSLIYITTETRNQAREIATMLIDEKLVACVNILGEVESFYKWNGEVKRKKEVCMIVKTVKKNVGRVSSKVTEIHGYECPCVISFDISGGNEDFLLWISESSKG